jgi:putative addiction module antidote
MSPLEIIEIGDSSGIVLPAEMLARLKLEMGDTVFLTETPEGYVITPCDPKIAEQLEAGREFMREFRDTFHTLAK